MEEWILMDNLFDVSESKSWFKTYLDEKKQSKAFLSTGYNGLDTCVDGFYKGTFNVIGARPGVGKTTLLLNLVLKNPGIPILFFTTEISKNILMEKLLCMLTLENHKEVRSNPRHFNGSLDKLLEEFGIYKICIVDMSCPGTNDVRQAVYGSKETPRLIFIDYFQNLFTKESKAWEYAKNVQDLTALAKETDSTVVCASQLHRISPEFLKNLRDEKEYEPQMSDLKETGKLEEASNCVFFLFQRDGKLVLKIAKNRLGETGYIKFGVLW